MQDSLLDFLGDDPAEFIELRRQDAMDLMSSQGEDSVELVVTDPPYGISYQSNRRSKGKSAPIAQDWNFQIGPFLDEVHRALKPGGAAYIFTRWDVYPLWARSVPFGLKMKNFIVWEKDNHSAGDLEGNFGFKYEGIMFLTKGRHKIRGKRWPNVWPFPRVSASSQIHPAEKPVPLLQRAIEASSDAGDLVIDPFCGSGSTGEAAVLLGRRALLGDVDKRVLRKTRERLRLPEDPSLVERKVAPSPERDPELCMDALDGVHPEDIAALVAHFRTQWDDRA